MEQHARHPMLEHLDPLVGQWETEATHRLLPDTVIRGRSTFEWLEGGRFLIWRTRNEHPDFPDSIAILGCGAPDGFGHSDDSGGGCSLRSFDSRGVFRCYALVAEPGIWRFWRDWPGFSQRFTGAFSPDGDTIAVVAELRQDDVAWEEDLRMKLTRVG